MSRSSGRARSAHPHAPRADGHDGGTGSPLRVADVYDPRSVRASTGSLFAVPTVRAASARAVLDWIEDRRREGLPVTLLGLDESGGDTLDRVDLTGPVVLAVGSERLGLSSAWRQACDRLVRIPIGGAASSLNAASAGTLALYEAARQRGFPHGRSGADG